MKRALPIILAVLLAVIAAGLVFLYTRGAEQRALDEQQPVNVLVSTAVIPQGMPLADAVSGGLAQQTQVPSTMVPVGAITALTPENSSLLALREIAAGEILLGANFGTAIPDTTALPVPPGKIGVSMTIGDPQNVGGFLRPGSEIVVFNITGASTAAGGEGAAPAAGDGVTTRVLIERATVLAVGGTTSQVPATNPDGTPATTTASATLTLALDQDQAEKLIQAITTGSLYLGLLGDGTVVIKSNGTTEGNLFD